MVKSSLAYILLAALLLGAGGVVPAHALEGKRLIDVSAMCTQHFARLERTYGIPKHLMMAISGTESGRWSNEVMMAVPWPWTINAEGKGQYFETMHEAVTAVRRLQAKGVKSIDVGCMQVNLKHHPTAFASVTQAFDPAYNTTYAAKFLRRNYDDAKSWNDAIAAYHSKGTQRGRDYFGRVKYNWKRVLAAVRGEPLDDLPYVARGGEGAQLAELSVEGKSASRLRGGERNTSGALSGYQRPSMKIIKVSEARPASSRRGEVLVIRPETRKSEKNTTVEVASNSYPQDAGDEFVMGAGVRKPLAAAPSAVGSEESSRRKGPNFIFN